MAIQAIDKNNPADFNKIRLNESSSMTRNAFVVLNLHGPHDINLVKKIPPIVLKWNQPVAQHVSHQPQQDSFLAV